MPYPPMEEADGVREYLAKEGEQSHSKSFSVFLSFLCMLSNRLKNILINNRRKH